MKIEALKFLVSSTQQQLVSRYDADSRVISYPQTNVSIAADNPLGILNRRGEEYTFGDIWYLATSPRASYTFAAVSEKNFRYINVVERKTIEALLQSGECALANGGCGATLGKTRAFAEISPIDERFPIKHSILANSESLNGVKNEDTAECAQHIDYYDNTIDNGELNTNELLTRLPEAKRAKTISMYAFSSHHSMSIYSHSTMSDLSVPSSVEHLLLPNGEPSSAFLEAAASPSSTRVTSVCVPNASFYRAIQIAEMSIAKNPTSPKGNTSRFSSTAGTPHATTPLANTPRANPRGMVATVIPSILRDILGNLKMRPLIVVPSHTNSASLNKSNAVRFLQDASFTPPLTSCPNSGEKSIVSRVVDDRQIEFRILESSEVHKLSPNEWLAVVAVIVAGPEWQFKNWPFKSFVDLFRCIKPFYFTYDDVKAPNTIQFWHVQVLRIHRTHKHYHSSVQREFWRSLEEFLLSQRKARPCHDFKLLTDST